jgi:hypothetical protein
MAASVTTIVASSCNQSESNMVGFLVCSLCVPLLDIPIRQLSTHLDWYPIFCFSTILDIATLQFILFRFVMIFLRWLWLFFLDRCTHGGRAIQEVLTL